MPRRSVKLPRYPMKKHFYDDIENRRKHHRGDRHDIEYEKSEQNVSLLEKQIRIPADGH